MFEIITLCMTYDTDECDFHVKYLENKTIHRSIQMFILSLLIFELSSYSPYQGSLMAYYEFI